MDFLVIVRHGVRKRLLALPACFLKAGLVLRLDSLLARLPRRSAGRTGY